MSLNMVLKGKNLALAVVDRRFSLENLLIMSDSIRINKLFNYQSERFHGSLAFVESPSHDIQNYLRNVQEPLIGISIINQFNSKLAISEKECVQALPSQTTFNEFYKRYSDIMNNYVKSLEGYNPEALPLFSFVIYDKEAKKGDNFRAGYIVYNQKKKRYEGLEVDEPFLVTGESRSIVSEYLNTKNIELTASKFSRLPKEEKTILIYQTSLNEEKKSRVIRLINDLSEDQLYKILVGTKEGLSVEEKKVLLNETGGLVTETEGGLLFYGSNAYMLARLNREVGGTCKITEITPDGLEIIKKSKRTAMNTISGAYVIQELTHKPILKYGANRDELILLYSELARKDNGELEKTYQKVATLTGQSVEIIKKASPGTNFWTEFLGKHED